VQDNVPAAVVTISLINPKTRHTLKTIISEGASKQAKEIHFIQTNISGWILESNRQFVTKNIQHDPRFRKNIFKSPAFRPALGVPLRAGGAIIGTILLLRKPEQESFSRKEIGIIENVSAVISPYLQSIQDIEVYFTPVLSDDTLVNKYRNLGMIGRSDAFLKLLRATESAARTEVRVLLEGASGTGKELIARSLHQNGKRSLHRFVAVDCGAIPDTLVESELFGHIRGTFTGATKDRDGLVKQADKGTLFLDEISNLPVAMQSKLLRFLQEGEFRPLGSVTPVTVDVRVIAATSITLRELVDKGEFRQDLFYRLNVYPIRIPDLQERTDDIPLLAQHFLEKFSKAQNKKLHQFHPAVLADMQNRRWNGNIRELENFVVRLVTLAEKDAQSVRSDLMNESEYPAGVNGNDDENVFIQHSLKEQLAEHEKKILLQALEYTQWNQSESARLLNISESNIRFRLNKLGINKKNRTKNTSPEISSK
ncbi:MAG: GAF domain-containing protein, partial [Candidatus Marinimicrobia bacterium]|nr:GAF domain-containing protein [Candidatus Neomarinimicrobiota bacterium]